MYDVDVAAVSLRAGTHLLLDKAGESLLQHVRSTACSNQKHTEQSGTPHSGQEVHGCMRGVVRSAVQPH